MGENGVFPHLKPFHFHPCRDPQECLVTLETQDFLSVYKRLLVLYETFDVCYSSIDDFLTCLLFILLIAGYSWPGRSSGSPRYSRM